MSQPQDRLLRIGEVLARVPVGKATLYKRIKTDDWPKPVKVGGAAMWSDAEISALVERLKSARTGGGQ